MSAQTTKWLIRKGGYYYRHNRSGYTTDISAAGRYTEAEARREAAIEPWHMEAIPAPAATLGEAYAAWLDALRNGTTQHETSGKAVTMLEGFSAGWEAALKAANARNWRHKKRGTTYEEIGRAELQDASGLGLHEGATLVIYRCDDGKLWARHRAEFEDGRFEELP